MDKSTFQATVLSFYLRALQAYNDKIINNPHSIGADELMDVLFSYGIRHAISFNSELIAASRKYLTEDFQPDVRVMATDAMMRAQDYQMGQLYYDVDKETYRWIGATGLLQERKFADQTEAEYVFRQEIKYQMLTMQSVIESIEKHQQLIRKFSHGVKHEITYLLLHYLNFDVMEDIWDGEKSSYFNLFMLKKYANFEQRRLDFPDSPEIQYWLIEYFKMNTHLDLDLEIFSIKHFFKLIDEMKNLKYPETHEPVFPRFDIHHEAILTNALGDSEISVEYQGELLQYFMALYPYMQFQEWNIENAQHLLASGQQLRDAFQKHLKIGMEDTFSMEGLKNLKINKDRYLAMMQALTPELREVFYDHTKEVFERLAKDSEFVGKMLPYVTPSLQTQFNIHSQNWDAKIDQWFSKHDLETCQTVCGTNIDAILKGLLHRLGYMPKENETTQNLYMTLCHFVTLNDYLNETLFTKGIFRISGEKKSAALWIKHVLMHPQEFSLEDLEKYEQVIKNGPLNAIYNSPAFQQMIDKNVFFNGEEESKKEKQTRTI